MKKRITGIVFGLIVICALFIIALDNEEKYCNPMKCEQIPIDDYEIQYQYYGETNTYIICKGEYLTVGQGMRKQFKKIYKSCSS